MILNNYIDNHLTDYEQPLTKREIEDLRALSAERELTDTFAHKMIRKLLPKLIKCLDSMKPQQLRRQTLVALEQVKFVFESLMMLKPLLKQVMNNQQISFMIKFFNSFQQTESEMRRFVTQPLLTSALFEYQDIFSGIQHLNWQLPGPKVAASSFVQKLKVILHSDVLDT